jgi:hypothetical protein
MKLLPCTLVMLAIAAPALADAEHTVDWYVAHEDERKTLEAKCANDPGDLANDPDCINAKQAGKQAVLNTAKEKLDSGADRIKDAYHDLTK